MKKIGTHEAPAPVGHYSQAVVHGNLVFVSGQLAIDPVTGDAKTGTIEEQTEQALKNLDAILQAAGSGKDSVLKTTVYISDIELWGRANQVYADFFGEHRPARAVVPTTSLHHGFLIEIEAVAATM